MPVAFILRNVNRVAADLCVRRLRHEVAHIGAPLQTHLRLLQALDACRLNEESFGERAIVFD